MKRRGGLDGLGDRKREPKTDGFPFKTKQKTWSHLGGLPVEPKVTSPNKWVTSKETADRFLYDSSFRKAPNSEASWKKAMGARRPGTVGEAFYAACLPNALQIGVAYMQGLAAVCRASNHLGPIWRRSAKSQQG